MELPTISKAEREIMECVWSLDRPIGSGDLSAAFADSRNWKLQTVSTFLRRLVEKKTDSSETPARFSPSPSPLKALTGIVFRLTMGTA